jgi:hypothetical protein
VPPVATRHVYEGDGYSLMARQIEKFRMYVPGYIDLKQLEQVLRASWQAALDTSSPRVTPEMLQTLRDVINGRRL